jgi:hypothetical protein
MDEQDFERLDNYLVDFKNYVRMDQCLPLSPLEKERLLDALRLVIDAVNREF